MVVRPRTTRSTYVRVLDPTRLRDLRGNKKMTLDEVAELISRSPSYVAQIERGEKRTVSPTTAKRLHLLYGPLVRYGDLFGLVDLTSGRSAA